MGENCFQNTAQWGNILKLLYLENAPKAFVDLEPSYSTIIYSQYFVFSAPSRLQYIYILYCFQSPFNQGLKWAHLLRNWHPIYWVLTWPQTQDACTPPRGLLHTRTHGTRIQAPPPPCMGRGNKTQLWGPTHGIRIYILYSIWDPKRESKF